MDQLERQDSVIVAAGTAGRSLYYIPYLDRVEHSKGDRCRVFFNGGEVEIDLSRSEGILFYGATGTLPVSFLHAANARRVAITFHRTHQTEPFALTPALMPGRSDLLTAQILRREDARLRLYLAREFCVARVLSLKWLVPVPQSAASRIRQSRSLAALRAIEAEHAAQYWDALFARAGLSGHSRRATSPLSAALDAAGMLLRGVLLRWVLHHRLSPAHGYLHEPTGYPSLIFDLIEPYRYLAERATLHALESAPGEITPARAVDALKALLKEPVYAPVTRQWVPAKSLLHGIVLALRAYLSGDMLRFVIPVQGPCKPGRPYSTTYRLPAELRGPVAPTARAPTPENAP